MLTGTAFAAVRQASGNDQEWLDTDTLCVLFSDTRDRVNMDEKVMGPVWTASNPVVRYVRCVVTEVASVPVPPTRTVVPTPSMTIETIGVIGRDEQ